jgi:hypothetical protein
MSLSKLPLRFQISPLMPLGWNSFVSSPTLIAHLLSCVGLPDHSPSKEPTLTSGFLTPNPSPKPLQTSIFVHTVSNEPSSLTIPTIAISIFSTQSACQKISTPQPLAPYLPSTICFFRNFPVLRLLPLTLSSVL